MLGEGSLLQQLF